MERRKGRASMKKMTPISKRKKWTRRCQALLLCLLTVTLVLICAKRQEAAMAADEPPTTEETPAEVTPSTPANASNEEQIYTYLTEHCNLSKAEACAIMANIQRESDYDPTAVGAAGEYGLFQWKDERLSDMRTFCAVTERDPTCIDSQLEYFFHELVFSGHFDILVEQMLRSGSDVQSAQSIARLICTQYEIPADVGNEANARAALAAELWDQFC